MFPCFVLCWIWNQQWSYNIALYKEAGLWVHFSNQKTLSFSRCLIFILCWVRRNTFSSLLFLLRCLFFLTKQVISMDNAFFFFFFFNYGGRGRGQGLAVWFGTCYIGQPVLELMCDSTCTCHHAWINNAQHFWSNTQGRWISGSYSEDPDKKNEGSKGAFVDTCHVHTDSQNGACGKDWLVLKSFRGSY